MSPVAIVDPPLGGCKLRVPGSPQFQARMLNSGEALRVVASAWGFFFDPSQPGLYAWRCLVRQKPDGLSSTPERRSLTSRHAWGFFVI